MKEKRITAIAMRSMSKDAYGHLVLCLQSKAFRLLGIFYKKEIEWYIENKTGDMVFKYN